MTLFCGYPVKMFCWLDRPNTFWPKLTHNVDIAIENYSIWNWLKNFTDPYTFLDFKSHFIWPEYYNQCIADKTDHLEWEVFDAGLTILKLNGKPLAFDYYILAEPLKYRFWIPDIKTNIYAHRLKIMVFACNWLKSCNDPYAFSDFKSHFVWPEYCNQCFADKTDHLEWEVFDAGLTILNGKPWALD